MEDPVIQPAAARMGGCRVDVATEHVTSTEYDEYFTTDTYYHTLTATAAQGWRFDHFEVQQSARYKENSSHDEQTHSETGSSTSNPCSQLHFQQAPTWFIYSYLQEGSFVGTEEKGNGYYEYWSIGSVVAVFVPLSSEQATIVTNSAPDGAGTTYGGGVYPLGTLCTVSVVDNNPNRYAFQRWQFSNGSFATSRTVTFSVSQDLVCTAIYEEIQTDVYQVSTVAIPNAGGVTTGDGEYESGEVCTINATAHAGYRFDRWDFSDGSTYNQSQVSFSVHQDTTCTAFFDKRCHVTTEAVPGSGVTTSGDGYYWTDDSCTVSVSYDAETYVFDGWVFSDGRTFSTESVTFALGTEDVHCVANLHLIEEQKFHVETESRPNNAGITSGDGDYDPGEQCTIVARERCSPWTFVRWDLSNGMTSSSKSFTFEVTQDVVCTARFSHSNTRRPYFDADGSGGIVCSESGEIFYDGDLVTA